MGISKITSTGIYTGTNLLLHNTGTYNTFVGEGAGNTTMTGDGYNTAVGVTSFYNNTTGNHNTAVGCNSLRSNTTGGDNSAVGEESLYSNTTGNHNTAVGNNSIFDNTTGSYNSVLGFSACSNFYLDPSYGVYIGSLAKSGVTGTSSARATVTNEIVIGASNSGNGSNTVTLGNYSITDTYLKGYIHNNQTSYPTGTSQDYLVPVVASSFGSSSGYIKYANGLLIQWGYISGSNPHTINLQLSYSSIAEYTAISSPDWTYGGGSGYPVVTRVDASHLKITNDCYENCWMTIGKSA